MKLLPFGIELQKFFLGQRYTAQELIYGLWGAYYSNSPIENPFFMEKVKLGKYLRYSSV
jgi:hypothetical protein